MEKNFIVVLIFSLVIAIFVLNNSEAVMIDFLFTEVKVSQALVILFSSIFGAITAYFLGIAKNIKLKKDKKYLLEKQNQLELENKNLEDMLEERVKKIEEIKESKKEME